MVGSALPRTYTPAMQDISFVSGVLAGRMSKSGVVGTVASFNFSNITWQAEGFRLGARYVNPKIKAFSTYINSFSDAGKAKEAAQAMIDGGADVIYSSTDQASRGIYAAAEAAGIYTIAFYSTSRSFRRKRCSPARLPTFHCWSATWCSNRSRISSSPAKPMRSAWPAASGPLCGIRSSRTQSRPTSKKKSMA